MTPQEAVMTPQEAVKILKGAIKKPNTKDGYLGQALDMAIKALEQTELEPSYNSIKPELDCISRTDALNAFKPKGISEELWMESNTYKVLTKLPSVKPQPNTEWIPCSERLPNEFVDVLCNTDSEEIFIATYLGKMNDGTDCFDDNNGMMWEGNIIAWMPLPQSYKAESEDEE